MNHTLIEASILTNTIYARKINKVGRKTGEYQDITKEAITALVTILSANNEVLLISDPKTNKKLYYLKLERIEDEKIN